MNEKTSGYILYNPTHETLFDKSINITKDEYSYTYKILDSSVFERDGTIVNSYMINTIETMLPRKSKNTYIGEGYPTYVPFSPPSNNNGKSSESNGRPFILVDPGGDPVGPPLSLGSDLLLGIFLIGYLIIKRIKLWL